MWVFYVILNYIMRKYIQHFPKLETNLYFFKNLSYLKKTWTVECYKLRKHIYWDKYAHKNNPQDNEIAWECHVWKVGLHFHYPWVKQSKNASRNATDGLIMPQYITFSESFIYKRFSWRYGIASTLWD